MSYYSNNDYYTAILGGDYAVAQTAKEDIIRTAIANGDSREEAEKEFESDFRSLCKKGYLDGSITRSKVSSLVTGYGGYDSNKTYWELKKWDYIKANGDDEGYSKYTDFYTAVKTGRSIKVVIAEYTSHGVSATTLATQITNYYKPIYVGMTARERAGIKGYLLNAYELLGYDRDKKAKEIDKWLEK